MYRTTHISRNQLVDLQHFLLLQISSYLVRVCTTFRLIALHLVWLQVDSFLFHRTLSIPDFDPHSDTYYIIIYQCKSKLDYNSLMPLKLATQGCICFCICNYKNRLDNELKTIIFFLITDHLVIIKSLSGDVKKYVFHITDRLVM